MKRISVLIFLLFIGITTACGQEAKKEDDPIKKALSDSIWKYREKLNDLEIRYKQEYKKPLENAKKEYKNEFDAYKNEIKSENSHVMVLLWVFGGLSIAGILGVFYQVFIGANQQAKKIWEDKLDKLRLEFEKKNLGELEDIKKNFAEDLRHLSLKHTENLEGAIAEKGLENRVLREKKILVICHDSGGVDWIKGFFDGLGFKNLEIEVRTKYEEVENYDLVIFNNLGVEAQKPREYESLKDEEKKEWDEKLVLDKTKLTLMKSYLENQKENKGNSTLLFIHFGGNVQFLYNYSEIASYANSKYSLYSRIMELLVFQEKKRQNKKIA